MTNEYTPPRKIKTIREKKKRTDKKQTQTYQLFEKGT